MDCMFCAAFPPSQPYDKPDGSEVYEASKEL